MGQSRTHSLDCFLLVNCVAAYASDQEILELVAPGEAAHAEEFNQRIALLLKHDWERARREGNLWLLLLTIPPERMTFRLSGQATRTPIGVGVGS